MTQTLSIFGATGSVGQSALKILRAAQEQFTLDVLSGGKNIAQLIADAREFRPNMVVTSEPALLEELSSGLDGSGIACAAGREALCDAAARPADTVLSAIVGFAGCEISLIAAQHCKKLALANKESLVVAGDLLKSACAQSGCKLIPVDSEHSAIFQCLKDADPASVDQILLTASGGPFLGKTRADLADVTLAQAVAHPNWSMGQRISIDSASLFNKAMELIETKELFDIDATRIEVVIHPQSIIHSMVSYRDGAILAHLGPPDMVHAIGYALNYPERRELPVERLNFAKLARLTFEAPDEDTFPALRLARRAIALGGASGAVFNAAKEKGLDLFIAGRIGFLHMAELVETALETSTSNGWITARDFHDLQAVDADVRAALEPV